MPWIEGKRQQVVELRQKNPCMTSTWIADKVGLSRERVRQILKSEGLMTKRPPRLCPQCGKTVRSRRQVYCSWKCRRKDTYIKAACDYCGKLKEVRASYIVSQQGIRGYNNFYCGLSCKMAAARAKVEKHRAVRRFFLMRYLECAGCGKGFLRYASKIRHDIRMYHTKHAFCTRECFLKTKRKDWRGLPSNIPVDLI